MGHPFLKSFAFTGWVFAFGVGINEKLAARFLLPEHPGYWRLVRRPDGTAVRP